MIIKKRKSKPLRIYIPESLDSELWEYSSVSGATMEDIVRASILRFLGEDREWQEIKKGKVAQ
ncbi:MAG: hypothetical protein ACYCQJ_15970 [Nitrososphaerales archaeon]